MKEDSGDVMPEKWEHVGTLEEVRRAAADLVNEWNNAAAGRQLEYFEAQSMSQYCRVVAAIDYAIEALEPPQDTAELRAEVERMAAELSEDSLTSTCEHADKLHEAEVSYSQQVDLRGALRARLGR